MSVDLSNPSQTGEVMVDETMLDDCPWTRYGDLLKETRTVMACLQADTKLINNGLQYKKRRMACPKKGKLLSFIKNELGEKEDQKIDQHLRGCEKCVKRLLHNKN